jgi:hypothetical protein
MTANRNFPRNCQDSGVELKRDAMRAAPTTTPAGGFLAALCGAVVPKAAAEQRACRMPESTHASRASAKPGGIPAKLHSHVEHSRGGPSVEVTNMARILPGPYNASVLLKTCRRFLLAGAGVITICLGVSRSVVGQSEHSVESQANLLPATVGEPLTIKPVDMQDIDCIVAAWQPSAKMPILTLICPPSTVFSPIRVLIKFSWMKSEDIPTGLEHIVAVAGTLTKIRTSKTVVQVWLPLDKKGKGDARESWIGFNAVVDIALLRIGPKGKALPSSL